jgi:molecular chaperone DnaK (HSP70)
MPPPAQTPANAPAATPAAPPTDPIVGIDLGTTYSLVAWAPPGQPARVLAGPDGRAMLPSVVRFSPDQPPHPPHSPHPPHPPQPPLVGWPAKDTARRHPRETIASVKRLMGRGLADAAASGDLAFLPYEVVEGEGRTARVRLPWGRVVSPQEVSGLVLRELRAIAETALGTTVRRAVVTVPAYFDDTQRQATRDAGRLAGIDVVRIVNEPTAAALAYGLGLRAAASAKPTDQPRVIVVYDLGGGTFDVSILRITPGDAADSVTDFFEVLATAGDTHLGGDDFDRAIVDHLLHRTHTTANPAAAAPDPETLTLLTRAAERAKIELSERESTLVRLELPDGTLIDRTITRAEFESWIAQLVDRTIDAVKLALRDARRKLAGDGGGGGSAIDSVVLVGGSTRVPLVRRRVAQALSLEPYTALNPDEVVALGAAEQARLLAHPGTGGSALLLDVIPLSLGLETVGGAVAKLIVRNATVPARATELFSTSVDGQTSIKLAVYQGEREMAADCRLLGVFHLRGLPAMPAGVPQVQVDFHVDANGVLSVSALERRSGTRAAIQIVPNHGLTREEVERIERDSVRFAREDMTRHRVADLIANSRLDVSMIRRQLDRHGDRLSQTEREPLLAALAAVERFIADAEANWSAVNPDAFQHAKEAMDRASMRLHEVAIAATLRAREP